VTGAKNIELAGWPTRIGRLGRDSVGFCSRKPIVFFQRYMSPTFSNSSLSLAKTRQSTQLHPL
jgi:hypothetical protein